MRGSRNHYRGTRAKGASDGGGKIQGIHAHLESWSGVIIVRYAAFLSRELNTHDEEHGHELEGLRPEIVLRKSQLWILLLSR